jgi:hypothetical protein
MTKAIFYRIQDLKKKRKEIPAFAGMTFHYFFRNSFIPAAAIADSAVAA